LVQQFADTYHADRCQYHLVNLYSRLVIASSASNYDVPPARDAERQHPGEIYNIYTTTEEIRYRKQFSAMCKIT